MRFLKLFLLLMALPASDNFNRANGAPGANWTAVINSFTIISNTIDGTNGADYNVMLWNADAFPDAQYSQLKISAATDGGPAVRITGTNLATAKVYYIDARAGSDRILKVITGTETQIASLPSTYVANDIAKLGAVGNSIQAYRNGATNGSAVTDSAAPTGSAGVAMFSSGSAYDDWEGGSLVGADASASQPILANPLTLLRCRPLGPNNPLREVKYYEVPAAPAAGITIVTDVGALVLDGFSPTLGLPVTIAPNIGQLDLIGFAAKFPTAILPGSGALSLTGFGPSVGLPKTIVPGFGQLSLSGFSATFPRTIVPATGALDLNGFAPMFARTIKPGFGDLQLNGFGPSFSFVSGAYTAQPGFGVLALAGFGPTIGLPRTLQPGSGVLVLSGNAPAIGLPITVRPASGLLTLTGFGPVVTVTPLGLFVTPDTGQLTLTGYAPWIGTFTFRIEGGPVMTATLSGGGVLVASLTGGPTFTGALTGGPV